MMTYVNKTVGELVAERPDRSRVFEALGIDYCCGGKKTLEQACGNNGVDPAKVIAQLQESETAPDTSEQVNWLHAPMRLLIEHILSTHHAYLKTELPRLSGLVEKVASRHSTKEPRLTELSGVYAGLRGELEMHMMKEEQILFPAIVQMETTNAKPSLGCGFLGGPIGVMEAEHDSAGEALAAIRTLTGQFTAPDWACNTFRALWDALQKLEGDLHEHIHKENNILFPRALEMEQRLAEQS